MLTHTPFISVAMRVCGLLLVIGLTASTGLAQDKAQNKEKPQLDSSKQDSSKQAPNASRSSVQPDIEISARVTIREMKFEQVGNPKVEFSGNPKRDTVWDADRTNLPRQVEPGVTYKDVTVRLLITSTFADIEQFLKQISGESRKEEKKTRQSTSNQISSPAKPRQPGRRASQ
jgi:hypothetical protein